MAAAWPTELATLQRIGGALLSTQSSKILILPVARARALGLPFDAGRVALYASPNRELISDEEKNK